MTNIIAIASEKGGVGKTTVALNLALALAERGRRVLLVDLDPQGGIGHALSRSDTEYEGLAEILMGEQSSEGAIVTTKLPELCLLPRGRLDPADACDFELSLHGTDVLSRLLEPVKSRFDYVLLDTPSGTGLVTRAALNTSDYVIIPFQAEPLCLRSLARALRVIERVRSTDNPRLALLGVLPTMVDRDDEASQVVMAEVWSGFDCVFDTVIPRAEVFTNASLRGVPVGYLKGPVSPEARRFGVLATEVEATIESLTERSEPDVERPQRALL
jgi:chromosome partitioning protein